MDEARRLEGVVSGTYAARRLFTDLFPGEEYNRHFQLCVSAFQGPKPPEPFPWATHPYNCSGFATTLPRASAHGQC